MRSIIITIIIVVSVVANADMASRNEDDNYVIIKELRDVLITSSASVSNILTSGLPILHLMQERRRAAIVWVSSPSLPLSFLAQSERL